LRTTHQAVRLSRVFHGHEVGHLGDAVGVEEARQQHVGVGKIELLARRAPEEWRDLEAPTTLRVDEGREHRRRVEARQAEEVDGSVHAYQGDRMEIADDAILPDGCVTTRHYPRARALNGITSSPKRIVCRAIMSSSSVGSRFAGSRRDA